MQTEKGAEGAPLLPRYEGVPQRSARSFLARRLLLALAISTWWMLVFTDLSEHALSHLKKHRHSHRHQGHHRKGHGIPAAAQCPAQVEPIDRGSNWDPAADQNYRNLAADRLRGAVRVPTVSYDDMGLPEEDPRFAPMKDFGEYLDRTFPLVHSQIGVERIATYGRLYHWKGANDTLKPLVLMAHQDVVPVNPATEGQWTFPPFDAHMDEHQWIWGRGAADTKNTLIGSLAAVEQLLQEGFIPERSVVLSFGADEEIGGRRTAKPLANTLLERFGEDGIFLIVDEGFTGVDKAYGQQFARLGMAEKGAISLKLEVLTAGGHSSVPPRHTGIGILSRLLVELEKHPDEPKLREGNPMLSYLNCLADYGDLPKKLKKRVKQPKDWKRLGHDLARDDLVTAAYLGTTQAIDLISGGVKVNALPEYVDATVNYRIDFLESTNSTLKRIVSILEPVVKSFNLTFDTPLHKPSGADNKVVRLSVVPESPLEPAPLTPTTGPAFELMSGTLRKVFPDVIVAPSAMIANTDTKWSWPLSKHIYRFTPAPMDLIKDFHTVNERIHLDAHLSGIRFFYKLIQNTKSGTPQE